MTSIAKDGLDSIQYVNIVDLISEGEIQGLRSGHRSIYLDNTPLATPATRGSYSRTGSTITINEINHGRSTGETVYLEFLSGIAKTGTYTVTSASANTFTVTSSATSPTSGTVFFSVAYTRAGDVVTVVSPGHKLKVKDSIYVEAVTGVVTTGAYKITFVDSTSFQFKTTTSGAASGRLLWSRYNFVDVEIYAVNGTQNQSVIPFQVSVETEKVVNVVVTQPVPVVRSITDADIDAVRITLSFPALQIAKSNGDVTGASVDIEIYTQNAGTGYTLQISDTVKGRSGDQYDRDYIVPISGARPVEVKVVRVNNDATSSLVQNSFSWSSYTEIVYAKLNYPNSALIGFRGSAKQFSNIPTRSFRVRGKKIRIPNNATVDSETGALIYSGVWNGTFQADQWCSDPAWALYDLLVSTRYGFGDRILTDSEKSNFTGNASRIDKWAFYAASQYCTGLNTYLTDGSGRTGTTNDFDPITGKHGVPDGFGYYEPRFSCNVNIQTAEEAYKLISDMCSVFRAMSYCSTGALTISQDRPADMAHIFTLANVTQEGFNYQSSSQKTRPTTAVVSYLDLDTRDTAYEVVEDLDAIARYGSNITEISAFACKSRGQASRIGKWLLYSEQYEPEIVSFITSIDAGVVVRPGQIIGVSDPVRTTQRRGGRITSATTLQVEVDDAAGISAGNNRTLSVILPDGSAETRSVSVVSGRYITVTAPFSQTPNPNSVWMYETSEAGASATQWRVLTVVEQDEINYEITAISYRPDKYSYVEQNQALEPREVVDLNEVPDPPTTVTISETLYYYQDQVRAKVIATWPSVLGVNDYQVHWRKDDGNWSIVDTPGLDYEVLDITPGVFEFKIYSLGFGVKTSATAATGSISALGKTAPPSDVSGLASSTDPYIGVSLTWGQVSDIDVDFYEIRLGSTWLTATLVAQVTGTTYKVGYLSASSQTFLIKAVDTSGVYSINSASITVTTSLPSSTSVSSSISDPLAVITWSQPAITSYAISYYRIHVGNSYGSSQEVARINGTSYSTPATWSGSRTFWVVPVDVVGGAASSPLSTSLSVSQAAAPVVSGSVSGTTATLSWNAVSGTLATASYEISRGVTVVAYITGTSYSLSADWLPGSQSFSVVAIDGNGTRSAAGSTSLVISAAPAVSLSSAFAGRDVVLSWTAVQGTIDTDYYIICRSATFNRANPSPIATAYATTHTLRVDWAGTQKFWVAAVDKNGNIGTEVSLDVTVTIPSAPVISQQVVDNNVLLRWSDSTQTLPIEYYRLWKGAVLIGSKQGGFTTVFESQAGTYTYFLAGVDSAGNEGPKGSISAVVNQPPDYVLQLDQNSVWAGEEVNIYTDTLLGQIVNVNTTETWQSHFTSRGYTSPQDQINAGYTYYLMPSTTTASYEEEVDYGALLAGTKISAILTTTNVVGSTTITPTIRVRGISSTSATYSQSGTTITVTSASHGLVANDYVWLDFTSGTSVDGTYVVATAVSGSFTVTAASSLTTSGNVSWVKWTSYPSVSEVFVTSFRYFRIRYDFASAGFNDLLLLNSLNIRLDSKIRNDAGTGVANSADSGGTTVNFNLAFADVQSISVTPATTSAVFAVYDFVDIPNPTSFKVLLFNTSGARVSGNFSWSARGV